MSRFSQSRGFVVALFLGLVAVLSAGVWRYGYVQAIATLSKQGQADLALASDRVAGQLQRYREVAVLMANHPVVQQLTSGAEPVAARTLFQEVADKTAALDVMYMDIDGYVSAAGRGAENHNLAEMNFAKRALQGALGAGIGADGPLRQRAYYFAAPHFGADGKVRGAVVVAADIAEIEWDWTGSNPAVYFTDSAGVVRITNRSELTGWQRPTDGPGLVPVQGTAPPFEARFIRGHELWRIGWGPYLPQEALHIIRDMPVFALRAEALLDTGPARRLAMLQAAAVAALCLAFGAILFLVAERRRTLAEANTKLEARVAERTAALSATNAALRREIGEREEAEAALRRVQEDLVQAGKLSALGQMSAGISHELNQPLMAIRSFAENGSAFLKRGQAAKTADNLGRITDLADRMGRIIRNLRSFARQESVQPTRVDLSNVLASAVELTMPLIRENGIALEFEQSRNPIWVRGGEVRLSQVFVNLISNAVDAMEGRDTRVLTISVTETPLIVRVQDTGPGIDMPDKVFEPFYSTKTVGEQEGMGLGLSISYGIVQSFGGDIRGANAPGGGAVFTVELERWSEEAAA